MKIPRLVIAVFVLLVLAGIFYWSEYRKPNSATAKVSAEAPPAILKLDLTAITQVAIKKKDAPPVLLAKSASGDWQISGPNPLRADPNAVSRMLSAVSSLNSTRVIADKAADLKPYGLDPPAAEVDITEKDNGTQKLFLGDEAPVGGTAYAMLAGDPRIFTIESFSKGSIDQSLDGLRNRKLFDFGFNDPNQVALHINGKDYLLIRNGQDWSSAGKKMDAESVRLFISKLSGLAASQFADSGFARPTIDATITWDDGKRVEKVLISKSGDGYVAKRQNESELYRLTPASVDDLQKAAEAIKPTATGK
jgi:hypothetical protein